jgi:hypothetical protein
MVAEVLNTGIRCYSIMAVLLVDSSLMMKGHY